MSLTFVNQYSFTPGYDLNVAFMRFDRASCSDGDGFVTVGWYIVPPGGSKTVYNGDVNYNRYWAYYAECPKDGATWTGDLRGWVSNSAFRLCHGLVTDAPARRAVWSDSDGWTSTISRTTP